MIHFSGAQLTSLSRLRDPVGVSFCGGDVGQKATVNSQGSPTVHGDSHSLGVVAVSAAAPRPHRRGPGCGDAPLVPAVLSRHREGTRWAGRLPQALGTLLRVDPSCPLVCRGRGTTPRARTWGGGLCCLQDTRQEQVQTYSRSLHRY